MSQVERGTKMGQEKETERGDDSKMKRRIRRRGRKTGRMMKEKRVEAVEKKEGRGGSMKLHKEKGGGGRRWTKL